ncbi:uncharacterized protein LOC124163719 [Ischnura elegans]|uniref:uncharacterized protein LOC124163719 n=1 Tax=Ischnura elegans TaxID=197161 RepID=UPI001ED8AD7D|nr:uncharacterized protein LOC124163719 [Ischnura elegans]
MGNCIGCSSRKTDNRVKDNSKDFSGNKNVSQSKPKASEMSLKGPPTLHTDLEQTPLVHSSNLSEEHMTTTLKKRLANRSTIRGSKMIRLTSMSPVQHPNQIVILVPPCLFGFIIREIRYPPIGFIPFQGLHGQLFQRGLVPIDWETSMVVRIMNEDTNASIDLQVVGGLRTLVLRARQALPDPAEESYPNG